MSFCCFSKFFHLELQGWPWNYKNHILWIIADSWIPIRVGNGMRDSNKLLTHERYMKMKNWYAKIFLIWTTSNYFWALEVWKIWGFQIKVVELPFYKLASNWNSEHISMEDLIFILQFFKFLRFSKILSLKSWLKIVWLTQKSLFCN